MKQPISSNIVWFNKELGYSELHLKKSLNTYCMPNILSLSGTQSLIKTIPNLKIPLSRYEIISPW